MTYKVFNNQTTISGSWFTRKQIARALPEHNAETLCDAISGGRRASGGYGANILDKLSRVPDEREEFAGRLLGVLPEDSGE